MAVSQSTFETDYDVGRAGQLGDSRSACTVESWIAEGSAGIGFGLAVVRGSADDRVVLGAGTAGDTGAPFRADNIVGVTLKSPRALPSTADPTVYQEGTEVSVVIAGVVWVVPSSSVVQGGDVTFEANGTLGSKAATAAIRTFPGAVWVDSASANGIARVRLSAFRLGS